MFYPDGGSWDKSPAVMYTRAATKTSSESDALERFIREDVEYMSKGEPNLTVKEEPGIETSGVESAVVRKFSGDSKGNIELVAYIEQPKSVAMIVLTSRNQKEFDAATVPFRSLVKSYKFMTDKVNVKEKRPEKKLLD